MKRYKNILHLVAIIASAIVSAITASGVGGDPLLGVMIGGAANSAVASL